MIYICLGKISQDCLIYMVMMRSRHNSIKVYSILITQSYPDEQDCWIFSKKKKKKKISKPPPPNSHTSFNKYILIKKLFQYTTSKNWFLRIYIILEKN